MPAQTDAPEIINWLLKNTALKQGDIAKQVGASQGTISKWRSGLHDPGAAEYQRLVALAAKYRHREARAIEEEGYHTKSAAVVDGKRLSRNLPEGAVPEFDHFGGAGGGGYPLPSQVSDGQRTYASEVVSDSWVMPIRFLRDELRVSLDTIDIVKIRGDSMETADYGGFRDGDRVVIDRSDKSIRQGGVFAVRDYDEVIIKQVEMIRGTDPVRIICKSLNSKYNPVELILDGSAEIVGRVVLKISRT